MPTLFILFPIFLGIGLVGPVVWNAKSNGSLSVPLIVWIFTLLPVFTGIFAFVPMDTLSPANIEFLCLSYAGLIILGGFMSPHRVFYEASYARGEVYTTNIRFLQLSIFVAVASVLFLHSINIAAGISVIVCIIANLGLSAVTLEWDNREFLLVARNFFGLLTVGFVYVIILVLFQPHFFQVGEVLHELIIRGLQ